MESPESSPQPPPASDPAGGNPPPESAKRQPRTLEPWQRGVLVPANRYSKIHSWITALLVVAVVFLSIQVARLKQQPAPEESVPPPHAHARPAAKRPVTPPGGEGVLLHQNPVIVGSGEEERIGFEKPGPVLERGALLLTVPAAEASASIRDFRLTRLYFTKSDHVSTGHRTMMPRKLNLWLPRLEGAYCNVIAVPGANSNVVQPARALPDGVWCLHRGVLADRQPAPEYCGTFIVGGLATPKIAVAKAAVANGQATLTFNFTNTGTGEFNEGRMVITLQKNIGAYGQFKNRWETAVDHIQPRSSANLVQEYSAGKWEPGEYLFWGHLNSDCIGGDGEAEFDTFKSNVFTIAAP